jgi:NAD(P)-dependent dehydrogenase (short-subunit alcohol dehydrogenase family)
MTLPLSGKIALVAGATRGAGRAIAIELAQAGAFVYCTGRSTRAARSDIDRPETIEDTLDLITSRGGRGVALRVDHSREDEVRALFERVAAEQTGRLDILVNDIWGGEKLTVWSRPFWEQSVERGLRLFERAVYTHIITARHALPLMVARGAGLLIEVTDGDTLNYRGSFYYDLVKTTVIRLAFGMAQDLTGKGVTALAVTPGFLRSEEMLDHFGVSEANWRDVIAKDPYFAGSETPHYLGRAVAALAADPAVARKAGGVYASWTLMDEYRFTDLDGSQPHWGRFFAEMQAKNVPITMPPDPT